MFGTEYPGRVVAPGRGQNNWGLRSIKKALQSLEKFWVDNVSKIAWINGAFAIQNAIYVQENNFHVVAGL